MFTVQCLTSQLLRYCTVPVLERYLFGTVQASLCRGILQGINLQTYIIYMTRFVSYFNTVGKLGSTVGEC